MPKPIGKSHRPNMLQMLMLCVSQPFVYKKVIHTKCPSVFCRTRSGVAFPHCISVSQYGRLPAHKNYQANLDSMSWVMLHRTRVGYSFLLHSRYAEGHLPAYIIRHRIGTCMGHRVGIPPVAALCLCHRLPLFIITCGILNPKHKA